MVNINSKIKTRLTQSIKKYQPILQKAKIADINESDTVMIITDMLSDVFGFDKYINITSEYSIKKTYCDLAVKNNDKILYLLECKAAGIDLKDDHIRQATNYSADSGIEWVVLTNGTIWKIYKILFTKPIEKVLVYELNLEELNVKKQEDLEKLYRLCKEAFDKGRSALEDFYCQKQIINRYIIGNIMMSDSVIESLRKTIKKLYPDIKTSNEELYTLIKNEIFKREITEGESAEEAAKTIKKAEKNLLSKSKPKEEKEEAPVLV